MFSSTLMTLFTCWLPSTMPRDASSSEQMTSSLTAFALAPGVLNTGMPSSVMRATGMLLVPAPQRTMPRTVGFTSDSCSLCERSMMAMGESGSLLSSPATAYLPDGNFLRPTGEMALKVSTVKALPLYSLPPSTALAGAALALAARSFARRSAFSKSSTSSSDATRALTMRVCMGPMRTGAGTPARLMPAAGTAGAACEARFIMAVFMTLSSGARGRALLGIPDAAPLQVEGERTRHVKRE
mmetsp:Transcript_598/g.1638  ORF Transcript_598/g.1638 Transcript_598/m.1638 type:complete len:241 (+) Transcript_598:1428-2150(+)